MTAFRGGSVFRPFGKKKLLRSFGPLRIVLRLHTSQKGGLGKTALCAYKHQQYVAVIVDHDNGRILEVLENREKATILAYLRRARAEGLLAHVEEVTTDMWDAYIGAAREAFGDGGRTRLRFRQHEQHRQPNPKGRDQGMER